MYPPAEQLPLAQHKLVPEGMPPVAYHHWCEPSMVCNCDWCLCSCTL
jgi:hypothetical protein